MCVPILFILAALTGCSALKSIRKTSDELKYSHLQAESLVGGIIGRIEIRKTQLLETPRPMRVCLENHAKMLSDDALALETQLVFAAWLTAADIGMDQKSWEAFEFVFDRDCDANAKEFDSYVRVASPKDEVNGIFQPQTLSCSSVDGNKTCNLSAQTLGLGAPGAYSSWFNITSKAWTKVEFTVPAHSTCSPYVNWTSLYEDLEKRSELQLAADKRRALMEEYQRLLKLPTPSLEDLQKFNNQIRDAKLIGLQDDSWRVRAQEVFAQQKTTEISEIFRATRAIMPTLLHEVGHQMGMQHAHAPPPGSVQGKSATTTPTPDGGWTTDDSAMAYAQPYLYPTDDDTAGIKSIALSVRKFLSETTDKPSK